MNGIDFFKSCNTNVRCIENILDLQYMVYSSTASWNKEHEIEYAIADLRERNVLCTALKEELWIFATLDDASVVEFDLERYGLQSQNDSWTSFDPSKKAGNDRLLANILLDAIEGSIAYLLAREYSIIHVGRFTWAFVGAVEEDSNLRSVSIHVDANLVESGVLHLSTRTLSSQIQRLTNVRDGRSSKILLAPSGQPAKVAFGPGADVTAATNLSSFSSGWMAKVSKTLSTEGIIIGADDVWINVEILETGKYSRLPWPQRLCLTECEEASWQDSSLSSDHGWMQWFGMGHDGFKSHLNEAETWLLGAAERESHTTVVVDDPPTTASGTHLHPTNMVAETPLATSPPFNQRLLDQQAALSGIYPTPPDGLLPGHLPQQPTSDGAGGAMHVEHSSLSNELQVPSSDDNQLGASSLDSTGEAQPYQMNSDDLFGDMGGMDFGANEVADADFDYFDEPDDLPQEAPVIVDDMDMTGDGANLVAKDDADDDAKFNDVLSNDQDAMATDESSMPDSRPTSSHQQANQHNGTDQDQDEKMINHEPSPEATTSSQAVREPERPLSPWGIRRQLLPMIPASAISTDATQPQSKRRSSTFEPITFNENLDLVSKYANRRQVEFSQGTAVDGKPSIALPQKRKKSRSKSAHDPDSGVTDLDSSSEDDSYESSTSMSDEEDLPPRLPWDTKKRKRSSWQSQATPVTGAVDSTWPMEDIKQPGEDDFDPAKMSDVLDVLLGHNKGVNTRAMGAISRSSTGSSLATSLPSMEDIFEIGKIDLIYVAQIVSEQAVSSIPGMLESVAGASTIDSSGTKSTALEAIIEATAEKVLPSVDECSISKLALVKEPPQRPIMNPGKAPQSGQPRLPQREGSMQLGPDYFPLPPPFIRVQRGSDTFEMLPPALSFWSALGLGPISGQKDVTPVALVPGNTDLIGLAQDFLREMGGVYEGRKLGSFSKTPEIHKALTAIEYYEDSCVQVNMNEELQSMEGALKAFAEVAEDSGRVLAAVGHSDPDRTIVVFIIDPFEDDRSKPYLAACFWKLCKAYRQHVPKAHVKSARSDLVLQLLPVSLVAAPDQLVVMDAQHFGSLAMELYDRCPPSSKAMAAMDTPSALHIPAAPAIELGPGPPKRVQIHLVAEPPNDLIHEGSVLHLAYALSKDMQWMAVNWMDLTGRYAMTTSTSLRGRSFHEAASEVWDKTLDILTARDVTWRIFIVSNSDMDASEAKCWRSVCTSKPRKQTLHATLISVQRDTPLQLIAPSPDHVSAGGNSAQAGAFLTPGSTPQGATMTVSPDASGQTAPPTPAPTDSTPSNAENDPDAHLVDVTDESWGMLLAPAFTPTSSLADDTASQGPPALANGVLFRRGDHVSAGASDKLESLGVSLHWDIRMWPNGAVNEGPAKQAEATLREVLRMYRSLGLLGRARNINWEKGGSRMVPVHLAAATKAAEALSWFRI